MARRHGEYGSVRDAILDHAAQLFTRQGIHGTSLNDIASACNLSKGTLYYYYPAKDSLVHDVAAVNCDAFSDLLFSWVDSLSRGGQSVDALMALIVRLTESDTVSRLHLVICSEAAMGNSELSAMLQAKYSEWRVMLEVAALRMQTPSAGALKDRSHLVLSALDGMLLAMLGGFAPENLRPSIEALLK